VEGGVVIEPVYDCSLRNSVEHVDEVNDQKGPGGKMIGGQRTCNEFIQLQSYKSSS
jgi:hypothetical protein